MTMTLYIKLHFGILSKDEHIELHTDAQLKNQCDSKSMCMKFKCVNKGILLLLKRTIKTIKDLFLNKKHLNTQERCVSFLAVIA